MRRESRTSPRAAARHGWPYGRRDTYYDPDSIPEEHRKPYEMKGMLPGVPDLVEEGGINRHLNNALREHEPNGGVLTAVEDFLRASHYELDLLELPGIHGLGILTPTPLKKQNADLARLLGKLDFPPSGRTLRTGGRESPAGVAGASARGTRRAKAEAGAREPRPQGRAAKAGEGGGSLREEGKRLKTRRGTR